MSTNGETIHNHGGKACDSSVCPNDEYCKGMATLHFCVPAKESTEKVPLFECHHLNDTESAK
jgi:hypothetical protein